MLGLLRKRESLTFVQRDNQNSRSWCSGGLSSNDFRRSCIFISWTYSRYGSLHVPIPLSLPVVELLLLGSGVMVEVEVDREKVFARGARCVSLSSRPRRVSKQIKTFSHRTSLPSPFEMSRGQQCTHGGLKCLTIELADREDAILTLGQLPRHDGVLAGW